MQVSHRPGEQSLQLQVVSEFRKPIDFHLLQRSFGTAMEEQEEDEEREQGGTGHGGKEPGKGIFVSLGHNRFLLSGKITGGVATSFFLGRLNGLLRFHQEVGEGGCCSSFI